MTIEDMKNIRYRLTIIYTNGLVKELTVKDWDHCEGGMIWYSSVGEPDTVVNYIPMAGIASIKSREFSVEDTSDFSRMMNPPEDTLHKPNTWDKGYDVGMTIGIVIGRNQAYSEVKNLLEELNLGTDISQKIEDIWKGEFDAGSARMRVLSQLSGGSSEVPV